MSVYGTQMRFRYSHPRDIKGPGEWRQRAARRVSPQLATTEKRARDLNYYIQRHSIVGTQLARRELLYRIAGKALVKLRAAAMPLIPHRVRSNS
jgi:hypothetical protein